jgi:hypothetical protein
MINAINDLNIFGLNETDISLGGDVNLSTTDSIESSFGGDVSIDELMISTKEGQTISLLDAFSEVFIDENLFASSIIGAIIITDTAGAIEKFELCGGEVISIKVSKPSTKDLIIWRKDLIVNRISRHDVEMNTLGTKYTLYFSSRSFVNSTKKALFKSYKDTTIGDAVSSIFSEMSKNDILIEDPKITLDKPFVCTGLMPHKAIEFLSQRSCSKSNYYVFFERFVPVVGKNSDGTPFAATHYFGSLDKLISDSDRFGIHSIYFQLNYNAKIEPAGKIRAIKLSKKDNFNHLESMMLGFYNTSITTIDPISRTHKVNKFGYTNDNTNTKDFYKNKLLNKSNVFSTYNDYDSELPGQKIIASSVNDPIKRESWLPDNIFGQLKTNMFKLEVDIQGGTNTIGVGHVINLLMPSAFDKKMLPGATNPPVDAYHSGKYFVSGVQHRIQDKNYIKRLELTRGSSPLNLDKSFYSIGELNSTSFNSLVGTTLVASDTDNNGVTTTTVSNESGQLNKRMLNTNSEINPIDSWRQGNIPS